MNILGCPHQNYSSSEVGLETLNEFLDTLTFEMQSSNRARQTMLSISWFS